MSALFKVRMAGFKVILYGDAFDLSPSSLLTQQQREFLKSHKVEIVGELKHEQKINDSIIHDAFDDRHYCRECSNLSNRRCLVQNFRPFDDIQRRCINFAET